MFQLSSVIWLSQGKCWGKPKTWNSYIFPPRVSLPQCTWPPFLPDIALHVATVARPELNYKMSRVYLLGLIYTHRRHPHFSEFKQYYPYMYIILVTWVNHLYSVNLFTPDRTKLCKAFEDHFCNIYACQDHGISYCIKQCQAIWQFDRFDKACRCPRTPCF